MSREFTANVVASSFIKQYYEMMTKTPENLYKFYSEDSNFMHSDSNETKNATGPDAIRAAIAGLGLKNAKVDLSNGFVDAQKSANNGVLVSVMGILTVSDDKPGKPFAQSFLLSNQGSTSYYVSNSIFRLLVSPEEHELVNLGGAASVATVAAAAAAAAVIAAPAAAVVASHGHATATTATAAPHAAPAATASPKATHSPSHAQHHHVAPAAAAETHAPAAAAPEPVTEEEPAQEGEGEEEEQEAEEPVHSAPAATTASAATAPAATATAAPADPNKKLNYSDIVRKQAAASAAPAAPTGLPVKRVAMKSAEKPSAAAGTTPASSSSSSTAKESNKNGGGSDSGNDRASVHAAYVRSLPEQTTVQELRDLFAQFGSINQIDHLPGRAYAFVKFADASSLQGALSFGGPLQLHGKTISVEERSSNKGGSREGGDGNRGSSNNNNKTGFGEGNKGGPRKDGERRGDGNRGDRNSGEFKKRDSDRDFKQVEKRGDDKRKSKPAGAGGNGKA